MVFSAFSAVNRCSLLCIFVGFLILLNPQASFAQESWWDFYDLALKDIRAKNWNLAEQRLKTSFRLQSEQGPKIRTYGARFIRYFPEYYLGVVYFHQGKHQEALEEFLRVQNKGLLKEGDEEYPELSRLRQQAFAKLNPSPTPPVVPGIPEQYASLVDQAQKSLTSGNYEQARNFANQAVALGTTDSKARDLLKTIDLAENTNQLRNAIEKNDLQLAQRIARKIEALDPKNPELNRFQQMMAKNSAEQQSREQFENLMKQAERQLASRDYGNARKTAREAQSLKGVDVSSAQELVRRIDVREASEALRAAINKKDQASAEKLAQRIENLDPQNPELMRWKQERGQPQEELDSLKEIMKSANRELARKNFTEAKRLATEAARVPGTKKQDIQDLLKKIDLSENSAILDGAIKRKDWISAQRAAAKISELDPANHELKELPSIIEEGLAVLSFYSGQYSESQKLLERAVSRKKASAKARFYLGCSYAALAFLQQKTEEGSRDKEKLLQNARQQFSASRKINPSLKYDQRFISPRILQIYERIQ